MIANCQPKCPLGQIVATPGALEAVKNAGRTATEFLQGHARGVWGDVCEEDRQLNDQALAGTNFTDRWSAFRLTLRPLFRQGLDIPHPCQSPPQTKLRNAEDC
jgi:hypothetical protein